MKTLENYIFEKSTNKTDNLTENEKKFFSDITDIVSNEISSSDFNKKFTYGENTKFKIKKSKDYEGEIQICFTKDDIHITNAAWFFDFSKKVAAKIDKLSYLKSFEFITDGIRRKIYLYNLNPKL